MPHGAMNIKPSKVSVQMQEDLNPQQYS